MEYDRMVQHQYRYTCIIADRYELERCSLCGLASNNSQNTRDPNKEPHRFFHFFFFCVSKNMNEIVEHEMFSCSIPYHTIPMGNGRVCAYHCCECVCVCVRTEKRHFCYGNADTYDVCTEESRIGEMFSGDRVRTVDGRNVHRIAHTVQCVYTFINVRNTSSKCGGRCLDAERDSMCRRSVWRLQKRKSCLCFTRQLNARNGKMFGAGRGGGARCARFLHDFHVQLLCAFICIIIFLFASAEVIFTSFQFWIAEQPQQFASFYLNNNKGGESKRKRKCYLSMFSSRYVYSGKKKNEYSLVQTIFIFISFISIYFEQYFVFVRLRWC